MSQNKTLLLKSQNPWLSPESDPIFGGVSRHKRENLILSSWTLGFSDSNQGQNVIVYVTV